MTAALKTDVYKKAHSALLLCLDNKVLREVNKENSPMRVWLKFKTLYMTKSLSNKLYLKKKLFTFYMHSGKKLSKHIDEFNKLIRDLANIDDDIDDEDQALMLLTSLSSSYDNFVETLLYGRESLTLKDGSGMHSLHSEGYENGDLLMVVSEESDNRACAIRGTGKVRVQMKYGSSFMLENVRYIPELERNLISLGTLDREGYTVKLQNGRVKVKLVLVYKKMRVLHRVSFGRGQHTTEEVIEYVHADLWGPSRVESMSGCRMSKEWKQFVENQTCRKLKKLRADNGLEFCNQEFNNLCKESGIARHLTVFGLPDSFWAEATVTAADLINRSPSTALEKKTPIDLWSGHPVNYEMLRIFGCVAYSYVNQGKLKPRAIKCIFLGYLDGVKGYRLWRSDDVKLKIIIRIDVVFNESLVHKNTLKGAGVADSRKEVEFEVELQGSRVEPTVDPHTRKNPGNKDEEQDEGPQEQNLDNYVLVRDRAKRTTAIPAMYRDEGNVSLSRPTSHLVLKKERATRVDNGKSVFVPLGAHFKGSLKDCPSSDWDVERMSKVLYANVVGLVYGRDEGKHVDVDGFVDADYAKDPNKGRSITGYVFMVHGCVVSWKATLQHVVALSTTETNPVVVNCDNQSAIHLSRNAMFYERMKHINVRYHLIREIVESKEIEVAKIGTKDNAADAFTKVVPRPKFKYCMKDTWCRN
ncbi:retrovirus-related pol polyprotein from transposon TNT 1-94 [Tanacetum coccineum]